MASIDPARVARVALPELNDEHGEQVRLLELAVAALDALASGQGKPPGVLTAIDAYYGWSRKHFGGEEERLLAAGYPELESHRAEHERALETLDGAERRYRDDGDAEGLRDFLLAEHLPWLERHIAGLDAHAATYLAEWA
jgi:hemerythrin